MLLGISTIREQFKSVVKCRHKIKMQNIQITCVWVSCSTRHVFITNSLHHPDTDTLSRVQKFKCTKGIQKLFRQGLLF